MMDIKKGVPLIDQHDENGYWGGVFGGNQIAESLNHPIEKFASELIKLSEMEGIQAIIPFSINIE